MRIRALGLLLAALPAAAGSRVSELPVALYTTFNQAPPQAVVDAMQAELETILGASGAQFQWRSLEGNSGSDVSSELAVLTFKGRCDVADLTFQSGPMGALGWTHMTDGVILPFADIDCDRIRLFLQRELLFFPAAEREAAFGRALARVVAHELYHIFANTTDHAADGICKSAFSVHDLLAAEFPIKLRNLFEIRRVLARGGGGEAHPGTW